MIASALTERRGLIVLNMSTLQERMEELEADGWTVGKIAAVAEVTSSAVSQWFGRTGKSGKVTHSISLEPALKLERATGYNALWLSKGELPKKVTRGTAVATIGDALEMLAACLEGLPDARAETVRAQLKAMVDQRGDREELGLAINTLVAQLAPKSGAASKKSDHTEGLNRPSRGGQ